MVPNDQISTLFDIEAVLLLHPRAGKVVVLMPTMNDDKHKVMLALCFLDLFCVFYQAHSISATRCFVCTGPFVFGDIDNRHAALGCLDNFCSCRLFVVLTSPHRIDVVISAERDGIQDTLFVVVLDMIIGQGGY